MALTQEKLFHKIEKLTSVTSNFPNLIHEAEAMSIINRFEKDAILTKYKSIYDKLTTFYLLVGSKGEDCLTKLQELLELSGNDGAVNVLLQNEEINEMPKMECSSSQQILDNLEKLISHTINPSLVLSFATGLELISGTERELIAKQCRTDGEQLEAFYTLVAHKGSQAMEKLIQVLRMTSNFWTLEVLDYHEQE